MRYANVVASLALFVALGGTATAAVSLGRDSVGSPQISKDAVRSSEISKDAVRSPEIVSGAVRTSEIRDAGVNLADISTGATSALLPDLHVAEDNGDTFLTRCDGTNLGNCPDLLSLPLNASSSRSVTPPGPSRNWLVQAKLVISNDGNNFQDPDNRCGLVLPNASVANPVLDESRHSLDQAEEPSESETISLSAVVRKRLDNPRIALRCTEDAADNLFVEDVKITALEVGEVTGP